MHIRRCQIYHNLFTRDMKSQTLESSHYPEQTLLHSYISQPYQMNSDT